MRRQGDATAAAATRRPVGGEAAGADGQDPGVRAEVSALLRASLGLVQWSPCGRFLAVATGSRLVVRERRTLQVAQQFAAMDAIQAIAWSSDSQLVSAALLKRAAVQVWSVRDPSWTCRINEGVAGLVAVNWAPDARHLLCVSDFQLHATVWSLADASARAVLRSPKLAADGLAFSPDGEFLAVAERHDCKVEAQPLGLMLSVQQAADKQDTGLRGCVQLRDVGAGGALPARELRLRRDRVVPRQLVRVHPPPTLGSSLSTQLEHFHGFRCIAVRDSHLEFRVLLYSPNGELLANYKVRHQRPDIEANACWN